MSRLVALSSALPGRAHPQDEITAAIGPLLTSSPERSALMRRLHAASGVVTRHVALPLADYGGLRSFDDANEHFLRLGTELAAQAAERALAAAGVEPAEVGLVLATTVTGVSAPSIDALVVERLGLPSTVRRVPSFGWGCAGGVAGVATVDDLLAGRPGEVALLVCVELCSLTIQHGDDSTANLVATGLFGDGAAAAVFVGDEHPAASLGARVVDSRSRLYPGTVDQLGWAVGASGLRIVLSAALPDLIEATLAGDVEALLRPHDLKARDVRAWVVHAGGPRILDAVSAALDLDEASLAPSRASLAAVGNLSSASALHVLESILDAGPPPPGPTVMLAFGPGVAAELVLLEWPEVF